MNNMGCLSLVVILVVCVVAHFVHGTDTVEETVKADDGEYEIITGDCNTALAKEMVYREHVQKTALPLVSRDAKSSWSGNARIYCLKVLNQKDESNGSTCAITDGGIGFDHVTIEMHSKANHGLEFDIEIYAS
ncbi:uncharacterized protein LOC108905877 [Anoplophora glabripennis]|uniref:uncharacterized protein LOC108905877 n=1 Tax=Anoplophora glabripennis TaxID=217634 RepID=UPI0008751508|nr:uncharacterized protein LOC108905877 [Anoplophora glabripennis]